MFNARGFFDYCISEKCFENDKFDETIKFIYGLGYRTIAVNQTLSESNLVEPKKKKKKGETRESEDIVPKPLEFNKVEGFEDMTILNRLTVNFSNPIIFHKVSKSQYYKKYHIIACLPNTTAAFMFICSSLEADIICFNIESKINIKFNRKLYRQLVDKGYYFEIVYSKSIEDSTARKNIIHMSHLYHTYGKSRNIIISSGATKLSVLRSPYDIVNLGLIFGLTEDQSKNAILHNGRKVYLNSVGRRHGKAVMFVENVDKPDDDVILLDSDEEDMETNQPATKRIKQ